MTSKASERLIFGNWADQASRHRGLSARAFRVLMMVAFRFDENEQCQISIEDLAQELSISSSTVKRALAEAVATGFLVRSRQNLGTANIYAAGYPR